MHFLVAPGVFRIGAPRVHDNFAARIACRGIEMNSPSLDLEGAVHGVCSGTQRELHLSLRGVKGDDGLLRSGCGGAKSQRKGAQKYWHPTAKRTAECADDSQEYLCAEDLPAEVEHFADPQLVRRFLSCVDAHHLRKKIGSARE